MGDADSGLAAEEAALRGRREAYVRATVVLARRPVSARPGDKAVVTSAGRLLGWVGGSCAEPVVLREARRALAEGTPRLLRLGPPGHWGPADADGDGDGIVTAEATCASEGSLQVFLEPVVPPTHVVLVGRSPLAQALVGLAGVLHFDATLVERDEGHLRELVPQGATIVGGLDMTKADVGPGSFVVVATMGRYDEDAVEAALATDARYIALVASDRRGASVLAALRASGASDEQLARVRCPAGLPLGDLPHEETAVAILAEIVQLKNADPFPVGAAAVSAPAQAPAQLAVDPICGMTVEVVGSTPSTERDGMTFWFCCTGCQRRFTERA